MKKFFIHIAVIICACLTAFSCERENIREGSVGNGECTVDLNFGYRNPATINVTTKSTLDIVPESRVLNMFVYIFVNGKRYYAHYFDSNEQYDSVSDFQDKNCWCVDQKTSKDDASTNGTIRIKAPNLSNGHLYIVANIDADMVNISPEKLNVITQESELLALTAKLNQEITSRNGLFPMVSYNEGVTINSSGITVPSTNKAMLERLDAKVSVKVRVATGLKTSFTDDKGNVTEQVLKEFRPESWQVINLPKGCSVVKATADYNAANNREEDYFNTSAVPFETMESGTFTIGSTSYTSDYDGFSFYMLENREDAVRSVGGDYHKRDLCVKDPTTGQYILDANDMKQWVNAPRFGTYMIIKGEVVMDVDVSTEAKQQQLNANVTYYVHLGDFARDKDNYSIERNTEYNYTITIKGLSNIDIEVETSNKEGVGPSDEGFLEPESGATGNIYLAKESIKTFDSHYGQDVFCFDAAYIEPETATWYVKTPFGREGVPVKVGDVEIPSALDYKWVHFVVNKVSSSGSYSYGGKSYSYAEKPYSTSCMPWPGDPNDGEADHGIYKDRYKVITNGVEHGLCEDDVMDVLEFTKYIKEQKRKLAAGEPNDFRKEFDKEWLVWYNKKNPDNQVSDPSSNPNGVWFRDRIYVTAFVDEFYYDKHPISGESSQTLWKDFVNVPNRIMHILCDSRSSFDEESTSTGSVVTIRQRSIQTPYSTTGDCPTAWGCEMTDENEDNYLFFFGSETMATTMENIKKDAPPLGNSSKYNGLFNTARLWGSVSGNSWVDLKWSDYINIEWKPGDVGPNGFPLYMLQDSKNALRYAAITRNRDNNGDGIINPEEIRWYTASLQQLEYLFLGELGIHKDARIYPDKYRANNLDFSGTPFKEANPWRCHIISSSNKENNLPYIIWAEESVSTSNYRSDIGWGYKARYLTRCARNLGFDGTTTAAVLNERGQVPVAMVSVTTDADGTKRFDVSNMNDKSKRFKTSIELEPYDETSEMARLYNGFETGESKTYEAGSEPGYIQFKSFLSEGKSACPRGYRAPNIREFTLMYLLDPKLIGNGYITSSYYSLGYFGNHVDPNWGATDYKMSWTINGGNLTMAKWGTTGSIRCVRDYEP